MQMLLLQIEEHPVHDVDGRILVHYEQILWLHYS